MTNQTARIGMVRYLSRRLLPLSLGVGLLLALLPSLIYWSLAHRNLQHMANLYAVDLSEKFRLFALEAPSLWKYQSYKFTAVAEGFHPFLDIAGFRVLDEREEPISGYERTSGGMAGRDKLSFKEIQTTLGSAPIILNDRRIGTVQVLISDRRLLRTLALVFAVSALIGATLALMMYGFPVRVVRGQEGEIEQLVAATRKLNEELEARVAEKTGELLIAQEELVRKEKLSILGQLSGCVGHELRNPLGVMNNAVYFLQTVMADGDDTTKEYLEIIKHEIDNSQRIITDLLDFARTRTPQTRAVAAHELVSACIGKCAVPENVALRAEMPETLPLLMVDPLQIGQVLQNLVTNALQAMPEGGALRIAARRVLSSEFKVLSSECRVSGSNPELKTQNSELDGDFVEISVADTGVGISPEGMKRLFQPLFTTKARGIGLGLVVCRNLVEANGGRIEAASRPGEGTCFTVILPTEE